MMRKSFIFFIICSLISSSAFALFEDKEKETLKAENERLAKELENTKLDRDNVLRQAKGFLQEKESLLAKIEEVKGLSSQSEVELESLNKENEMLQSEVEKMKAARLRDQELFEEEKRAFERRIADAEARTQSLTQIMTEYTPEKIQALLEDNKRLQGESEGMARRVLEMEKRIEEMRRAMTPLELDREELQRAKAEKREMEKRVRYVEKLEQRQGQLIRENAEYRERLEVMKAKFKEAAPGLAKSTRVSQKMMRENADMHYNLGTIFLHNKQYRQAIDEYENVLELRPADPETHYNLGVLYDDYIKDRQKALYHYQKYLAINPKAPDAKKVESYILTLELEQKVR